MDTEDTWIIIIIIIIIIIKVREKLYGLVSAETDGIVTGDQVLVLHFLKGTVLVILKVHSFQKCAYPLTLI